MRNLKRLLTMVMAIAMLMSLMVVGAGATSFGDDKDITHKDAVEKMVSLNVINGRDGNFDPNGIVTRAEMAKMICVALNGGNDPKRGTSVTTTFTDTKGHWAEGYIEYCVNMGLVAGLGNNTFGPDQKVTPTQAAKMLLVALGYDPAYEKFTGPTWALATNKIAQGPKGLYDEIMGVDPNAPMTRDAAAQMIYNFCYANMVKYEFGISGTGTAVTGVKQASDIILATDSNGKITYQTILSKYFKLVTVKGILTEVTYDSKKKEYGYEIDNGVTYYSTANFSDKFGMKVELLYKDKSGSGYNRNDDSIYDINVDGSEIIAQGAMTDFGKFDDAKDTLKFNGTTYDVNSGDIIGTNAFNGIVEKSDDSKVNSYLLTDAGSNKDGVIQFAEVKWKDGKIDSATVTAQPNPTLTQPYNVKLIDNNDDGKIDCFVVTPFTVQKVTYVGSDSVTFAAKGGAPVLSSPNVDKKDMTFYDGIAKDDIVAYYAAANSAERTITVAKMDIKSAKVSAVRDTKEIKIGDTWYTVFESSVPKAGDTIDYAAVGTNIYYTDVTEANATSRNVLAIYDIVPSTGDFSGDTATAKVIFGADGVKKTVTIAKLDGKDAAKNKVVLTALENANAVGMMYSYKVNTDGEYELTSLTVKGAPNENLAGHDGYIVNGGYKDKKINGYEIADNATILMIGKNDNSAKKYNGAELKRNYGTGEISTETKSKAQILFDKTNGFNYVTVATLVVDKEVKFASGTQYGYLTDGPGYGTKDDGKDYNYYTVWTKDGQKELKEQETGLPAGAVKGAIITYNIVDGDLVKDVTVANVTRGLVNSWDDKNQDKIQLDNKQYDVDKDTTIFNIDSANHKGADGHSITEGNGVDANAYYIINNEGKKVDLIVVDLSGKIAKLDGTVIGSTLDTKAKFDDVMDDSKVTNLTIKGDFTPDYAVTVPANKTLTIDGNATFANNLILEANAKVTVTGTATVATTVTIPATASMTVENLTVGTTKATINTGTLTVNGTVTAAADIEGNGTMIVKAVTAGDYQFVKVATTVTDAFTAGAETLNGAITFNAKVTTDDTDAITVAVDGVNFKGGIEIAAADMLVINAGKTVTLGGEIKNPANIKAGSATYNESIIFAAGATSAGTASTAFYPKATNVGADFVAGTTYIWNTNADAADTDGWKAQ